MSTFHLPDLGEGLHEAEIVAWHVAPGDRVGAGDTLLAVETDKAVVEIPAPEAGTIATVHGAVGDHVAVGAPLVDFADDRTGEASPAMVGRLPTALPAPERAIAGRVKAAPAVRAEARRRGIELDTVTASGPEGTVTLADLDVSRPVEPRFAQPLHGPRRAMARNMSRSWAEVAATTITDQAVVGHWTAVTDVTVELILAIVAGCRASPALNAWFDGRGLTRVLHEGIDLGVAVDTADGLFVPVLRGAEALDASAIRRELDRLEAATATRSLAPAELAGPTFTLSNFGLLGGRHATLMIVPPQVAILGAGRAAPAVVAEGDRPVVERVLPLSLTFDHRVVTGGEAARFLQAVITTLERRANRPGTKPHG
jgi:2-oxoisovalerate dehydrogenase E2 component (dihydrolipoyl transacylase)